MKQSQLSCCDFLKRDISSPVNGARQQKAARSFSTPGELTQCFFWGGFFFPLIRTWNLRIRGIVGRAHRKRSFEVDSIDCGKKRKENRITCLDLTCRLPSQLLFIVRHILTKTCRINIEPNFFNPSNTIYFHF